MGARKRVPAAERRVQLLGAATVVFARSNYRAATVSQIAHEAGVSEPLLYKHFASKRDMFCEVLERIGRRIVEVWEAETADVTDPLETLRLAGEVYLTNLRSHTAESRLQFQALAEASDPKIAAVLKANHRNYVAFFERHLRRGQLSGAIRRDVDAGQAAWLLNGTGFAFTMRELLDLRAQDESADIITLVLDWLRVDVPAKRKGNSNDL